MQRHIEKLISSIDDLRGRITPLIFSPSLNPSYIKNEYTFLQLAVSPKKIIVQGYKYLSIIAKGGWWHNAPSTIYMTLTLDNGDKIRVFSPFKNMPIPDTTAYITLQTFKPNGSIRPLFDKIVVTATTTPIDFTVNEFDITPHIGFQFTLAASEVRDYAFGYLDNAGAIYESGLNFIDSKYNKIHLVARSTPSNVAMALVTIDGSVYEPVSVPSIGNAPGIFTISYGIPYYRIRFTNPDAKDPITVDFSIWHTL